jgi:hypothetical protein
LSYTATYKSYSILPSQLLDDMARSKSLPTANDWIEQASLLFASSPKSVSSPWPPAPAADPLQYSLKTKYRTAPPEPAKTKPETAKTGGKRKRGDVAPPGADGTPRPASAEVSIEVPGQVKLKYKTTEAREVARLLEATADGGRVMGGARQPDGPLEAHEAMLRRAGHNMPTEAPSDNEGVPVAVAETAPKTLAALEPKKKKKKKPHKKE